VLTSARNPKVAAALRLKKRAMREEERAFLVEGAQAVAEALAEPGRLRSLFVTDDLDPIAGRARAEDTPVEVVSERVMERMTSTVTPQGLVGIAPFVDVDLASVDAGGCVAVLHEIRDPGNAGTILRSADAAGAHGVVLSSGSVDVYNPKAVRASAGSVFHVPVVREIATVDALATLRSRGSSILAMDARGEESLFDAEIPRSATFVFGTEAHGLPEEVLDRADRRVCVPQPGRAESLNLAAAATVCLFEWVRRGRPGAETLESLVAAAAHDLRSPLTALKGFGYALGKRWADLTDDQRDVMLRGILHDADRMDTIVRQLLDAARVMGGRFEPYAELTDVADLVRQVAEQQRRDPGHPPIEPKGGGPPVLVDAARLRTTVLAFMEALVWWGSDGPIAIETDVGEERLRLTASRTAGSIAASEVDGLFEARRPGSGGGSKIGLYVARRVADAQGGRTWGEISDGRLTLGLDLPVARPARSAP
jgi:RNA methyltransferase, TrmH family